MSSIQVSAELESANYSKPITHQKATHNLAQEVFIAPTYLEGKIADY